jgi:hypothetical protein
MKAFFNLFAQQIASATVDYPYSGILINQSIEQTFTVLQWETERALVTGSTLLSLPSGLSSNRQTILFLSSDDDVTLTIVSRDYADTLDQSFTTEVSAEMPFCAVFHNIVSATVTAATATTVQSFIAKVSPAQSTSSTSPNQGLDPGSLPIGGLIPLSGTFASSPPLAGYSEAGILPLPSYLQLCDGSLVTDSESIFFGKFLPNLTGNKTLFGSTTAGVEASSSTSATVLMGFGADWNIYQSIDVAAAYTVKYYIRIK